MITQCHPQIPVFVIEPFKETGPGYCVAWIDYSQDHDTLWKIVMSKTGHVWDVPQSCVRGVENVSLGRGRVAPSTTPPQAKA